MGNAHGLGMGKVGQGVFGFRRGSAACMCRMFVDQSVLAPGFDGSQQHVHRMAPQRMTFELALIIAAVCAAALLIAWIE